MIILIKKIIVYIEMFTGLKQAHDYDYCSYAE